MPKNIVYYHVADLDGHCSGAVAQFFMSDVELRPINYGWVISLDGIKGNDVYFLDFCPPVDELRKIKELAGSVAVYDHHATAIQAVKASGIDVLGIMTSGEAGCILTWRGMSDTMGDDIPPMVRLLGEYDVWDHHNPDCLPLQWGMRQFNTDPLQGQFKWDQYFGKLESRSSLEPIISDGKVILRYEERQNEYAMSGAFDTRVMTVDKSYTCLALNKAATNFQAFKSKWNKDKYDVAAAFCWSPKTKNWKISLYSDKPGINCGEICKFYGGGGHAGAAGCAAKDIRIFFRELGD